MNKAMPIWANEPTGVRVLRCAHILESMGFIDRETVVLIEAKVKGRSRGQHHQMDFSNLPLSADPIRAELTALRTRVAELESTPPPRTYEQGAEEFDYFPWTTPFSYECGYVFDSKGQKILNMRGWGFLTGKGVGGLGMSEDSAAEVQDKVAAKIISLMNIRALPTQPKGEGE